MRWTRAILHWLAVSSAVCLSTSLAAARPMLAVANLDQLYEEVTDPGNAGVELVLAPGFYQLDPAGPNGGRLELQADMAISGVDGNADLVTIDASRLPATSYQIGMRRTGAVRLGRGANELTWLTVQNASDLAAVAAIDTDLESLVAFVRIAHVIAKGSVRGIDLRNLGGSQAGRRLEAEIEANELRDNLLDQGQGLRAINTGGADGASIHVRSRSNLFTNNLAGFSAEALNTSSSTIDIDSAGDRWVANGVGCDLAAGASLGPPANDNRMTVSISGGALEGNQGPLPPDSPGGAILAIGGLSGTKDPVVNRNQLHVSIAGTRFDDNQIGDLQAIGAFSTQHKVAGTYNSVVVELQGISTAADVLPPVASVPKEKEGTNTATILY